MDRSQADALVSELGEQLGIAGLALDESGSCTLAIDDGAVVLSLGHNPGASSIDLMICLDDIDTTRLQLRRVLLANFGWLTTAGASFALEPMSGALVLQRRCTAADLGHGGLRAVVESLVGSAEGWSKRLAALADSDGAGRPPEPEGVRFAAGMVRP